MRTTPLFAALAVVAAPLHAQQQPPTPPPAAPSPSAAAPAPSGAGRQFTPADLRAWKAIRLPIVSNDGRWFAYVLAPNEGDAEVVLKETAAGGREWRFPMGEVPTGAGAAAAGPTLLVSGDARWAAFTAMPSAQNARRLRRERRPLLARAVLVDLTTGKTREFDRVRRVAFSADRPRYLAMLGYGPEADAQTPAPGGAPTITGGAPGVGGTGGGGAAGAGAGGGARAAQGADLTLLDLTGPTGGVSPENPPLTVGDVGEFAFDDRGDYLAWTIDARNTAVNGVQMRDLRTGAVRALDGGRALYRRLAWTDSAATLAVLRGVPDTANTDTAYAVVGFTALGQPNARRTIVDLATRKDAPTAVRVSADRAPRWTADGSTLLFGLRDARRSQPVAASDGAPTADDRVSLVVWHWRDPRLQSQQQVEAGRDRSYSYLAAYRASDDRLIRVGDDSVREVTVAPRDRFAVGADVRAYEREGNLTGARYRDLYVTDLRTGVRRLAVSKLASRESLSPDGRRILYFEDGQYNVYDMETGARRTITTGVPVSFVDTEDDHNVVKPAIPALGWSRDGRAVLLSDNWDVWQVPVEGGRATNLTVTGRRDGVRYARPLSFDPRRPGIDLGQTLYFPAYGERTKKEGVAVLEPGRAGVRMLRWDDAKLGATRARDANVWIVARQNATTFPDYHVAESGMATLRRLTDANPQQREFAWSGGTRLVDYVSDKGDTLQAALFLPANYQPGRRYPTVVYIYEKLSQNLHVYNAPNETRALNPSVYTSRGYAVLMPDITYRINDPGMSAVWCVVPAVRAAVATGIVDSAHVGLHGHSWGGYQTAFLVTQTNIFKAAVAGAALTDMVSMYSSIYWNTGGANQAIFQSSQGRFKGNYLENMDAYLRNSPAFHANKVQTPLLMLHNDKDGAVDFNQGITFYNTLRQLGKDVVLLEYVGENHGLARPANMKDYAGRMREFFDYHLMGAPAPEWLKNGVPHLRMDEELRDRRVTNVIADAGAQRPDGTPAAGARPGAPGAPAAAPRPATTAPATQTAPPTP